MRYIIGLITLLLSTSTFCQSKPDINTYIHDTWQQLTRTHSDLLAALIDPKFSNQQSLILYIPNDESITTVRSKLKQSLSKKQLQQFEIRQLPKHFTEPLTPGLLYLPKPYVVPGGRFNELYGWDSFFIVIGLLEDNKTDLAIDITDNFTYEIEHYGTILNANRSYYLQRSQPPLYSQMIRKIYERTHDKTWLDSKLPSLEKLYTYWTTAPHLDKHTGLSRYYALGNGPAPEVVSDELDAAGMSHYRRVKQFYRDHHINSYDVTRFYDAKSDQLTPLFYKADRTVRESGFDPSNRYGPFSVEITDYVPTGLNSLLYQMEKDMAYFNQQLDKPGAVASWEQRAKQRAAAINRYLWDPAIGLYLDYNTRLKRNQPYVFATTLYPLWAGIATKQQAQQLSANLPLLMGKCGLLTSPYVTGNQWDAPYGWAPLQWFAVHGLKRYGYTQQAEAIQQGFSQLVETSYQASGTIVEKYDVRSCSAELPALKFGYNTNEIGFGWTNAVYLDFNRKK